MTESDKPSVLSPPGDGKPEEFASDESADVSRLQLLWDVVVFQFKLVADGLRDVLLSPVSIISAIMGLLAGGDKPDRYFRQVLRLGRRSEIWINLFGYRKHSGTSDEIFAPLKDKVFAEAQNNPWVNKVGSDLNRKLDDVNASITSKDGDKPDPS
jgi:hypothetical protein